MFLKGEPVRKYLRDYRESQWFSRLQLAEVQAKYLRNLLVHSASSEFHRGRWKLPSDMHDSSIEGLLSQVPTMTKSDLATHLGQLVVSHRAVRATRKTTGGSTGQPVTLLKNPEALARERAATYRAYEWAGIEPAAPQARFWGVPHKTSRRMYYKIADFVANRRRFSAFNFDEVRLLAHFQRLVRFRPRYLYGYVSMLQEFGRFLFETKRKLPDSVVAVVTTSEVLSDGVRAQLRSWLGVPIFNEYGCGEVGSIAHECEHGHLHVMAENLIVEVVDEQGMAASHGELVVTDLHNFATPLIRYRVGDYATLLSGACRCGRGLPCLERVHGRAYDMVRTPDGLKVHPESIIYVFEMLKEEGLPIHQFQVEQTDSCSLTVRLVCGAELPRDRVEFRIEDLLRRHISPGFRIKFERVAAVPRERSGKIRLVKCSYVQ